jgi:[protein-PII] uridylyltransferase
MTQAIQTTHRTAGEAPKSVRQYLMRDRPALQRDLCLPGASGMALAQRHADLADELVRDVFARARGTCAEPLLLGAVGGYGRRLLALGSDLDLCFVTTAEPHAVSRGVEAVLYPLWDAGISLGHQIVRPSEVAHDAASDLAMATELLDFRPLAGDLHLMEAIGQRLSASIFSSARVKEFIAQIEVRTRQRHMRFGDSVYLLEPDVKNGTGGLRDLDAALWAARARFGTSDLDRLVQLEVLSPRVRDETLEAIEFLWTTRNHLHRVAGRKADRLLFGEQEKVALAMGYGRPNDAGVHDLKRTGEMVEAFMSDYYRHARRIAHTRDRIFGRTKRRQGGTPSRITQLGNGLVECEGSIGLAEPERVLAEPALALRVYAGAVARDLAVLSHTRDSIAAAAGNDDFRERLRASSEASQLFVALMCVSRPAPFASGSVLSELHDVGLLLAMIPEFAPVVGRVHHDLYHVYTVDVHSIAAVDRLHALARGELARNHPLATRLAAEVARPRVLFMATLLHDVGKAIGGRNHAQRGALMARTILARFGFSEEEIDDTAHLILHHLTMYMVAIRRDLTDPGTVTDFLPKLRDRESLRELYLLTVADVSTTSPQAMTKWKRGMLDGLFRATDAAFSGSLMGPTDRVGRVRSRALLLWPDESSREEFEHFLSSMPARYFLANTAEEVVVHANLALRRGGQEVLLSIVPSSHDGVLGLCVVTEGHLGADVCVIATDRPGLLASITAAISSNRFDVQGAQINSRELQGGGFQAVDVFWVRGPADDATAERRLLQLKDDLARVIRGDVEPKALVHSQAPASWSRRGTPRVMTEVLFDHHASESYTIIEVLAEDRPALLFTLTSALHEMGVSIGVAKISTEGSRAVDVFYAAEADGSKIDPGARSEAIRDQLVSALATEDAALAG